MAEVDEFESGHHDRVTVLHVNFDGTRILTASADHRVKVWERDPETGLRTLTDTWTAHDADIRDAKWLHPTTGSHIATIGNDLLFRLWAEDPSQPPNIGRRFKRISSISSTSRVPFVSLDLKNIDSVYTYLALIDRQGLLSVYEPTNPDEFKEWTLVDRWHATLPPPGRGQETSFKVRFDQNPTPLPYVNNLSDDRNMLSIAATSMNEVRIYRSVSTDTNGNVDSDPASRSLAFVEVARIPPHPALIRDVQWAPFNVRGTDLIATACRDGCVRIFELAVSSNSDIKNSTSAKAAHSSRALSQSQAQRSAPQSSLTTAIAGRSSNTTVNQPATLGSSRFTHQRPQVTLPFKHEVTRIADLVNVHKDAWALAWDPNGQVLMSNGSDGVTKLWKQSIMQGEWMLFADQEINIESGDEDEGGDGPPKHEQEGT